MSTVLEPPTSSAATTSSNALADRWYDLQTWAASRERVQREDKELMARYFAEHDFLLRDGANPAKDPRETAAGILVNQGTGPDVVVAKSLEWITGHADAGPFHIIWYSPSALVPATLYAFRKANPGLSSATHVHLFPGAVDIQLQAQVGPEAQEYARRLTRRFSAMVLSGYSFDLRTGIVKFQFDREIPIQRECALLSASEKFLFFDSKKFTGEGEVGYSLHDLLTTCTTVVIYTVSSERSGEIKDAFEVLAGELFVASAAESDIKERKSLRLTIVGKDGAATQSFPHAGYLRRGAHAPTPPPGGAR